MSSGSDFKREFNSYLGFAFEKIAMDFLVEKKPFRFQKIGRWWHRDKEIDLVALNEGTKEIALKRAAGAFWADCKEIRRERRIKGGGIPLL